MPRAAPMTSATLPARRPLPFVKTRLLQEIRHCEERSDEAIHLSQMCVVQGMDCFASLAMTVLATSKNSRGQRRFAEYHVGRLLRDHDGRRVGVARRNERHHRSVDDAYAEESAEPEIGRHDGVLARTHRAGSRGMVVRLAGAIGVFGELLVGA